MTPSPCNPIFKGELYLCNCCNYKFNIFVTIFLVICMIILGSSARTLQQFDSNVFDVLQFGGVGDGAQDDSQAFLAAWTAACGAGAGTATLTIPAERTYLLNPFRFEGPCKSSTINVQIIGRLVAPDITSWPDRDSLEWIVFSQVDGLIVNGNGVLDGRGSGWWSRYKEKTDHLRPTALAFEKCNNLQLRSLTHIDSPRNHISIRECSMVNISNLEITAPGDSPNTDGIDFSKSSNVEVRNCIIATGDDCIAINGGCANMIISNVGCGPGHGISIGSLGENGATDTVEEIHVRHSSFYRTAYGARIKTWPGGSGYARHISFEDITLIEANHPIIINQFYCNSHTPCKNQTEAVRISDVTFDGFRGTSASDDAITFSCSETYGCSGIVLNDINIVSVNPTKGVSVSCSNAHGIFTGTNSVVDCL